MRLVYDVATLLSLVAVADGSGVGALTYLIKDNALEIVSLTRIRLGRAWAEAKKYPARYIGDAVANTVSWFVLQLLDTVDLSRDPAIETAQVRARLPALEQALVDAGRSVDGALAPRPPWHPADDTWDDQIWFIQAVNQSATI